MSGAQPPRGVTVRVQEAAFDLAAEGALLTRGREDVGGLASFVGLCRADDGLSALVLEHYPGMTERAIRRIAEEAYARWPLTGCTVVHRVGRLEPGAPIVLVLTASAHRAAALEACAFLIDWLKTRAPFWKREEFAGGGERWVEAKAADDAAAARWDRQDAGGGR
ncbi:molybdenum cofactor biosynthesis protein MoaE [Paracraurococcus ruber]|uniref:Molybdopterin synthase catalytic subunit n=1 Tax=Paracraurococcus ruber TaxID=77675 RepID=A0ABS1CZF3_9PROT|nr:molybdenum cofactor biosynthesis protein MoaE [Paracraurococcus ruber]MBK1659586.1 molybdenum cofactor biosynthesis protein MoaE [Paracraurococcus ruber]TDG28767.1 molybdenum cofactor biosynthesis protein MoaE [Paracraurococcus ruber]